ncbi:MAG TPA: FtsW/RodA/SpoVE family cell cycle protein, partial [Clostridiaceae bacterium]|nr:FtsW/RodA/SpoVE family cell cycle protein [Clostridiaceae bacterium]
MGTDRDEKKLLKYIYLLCIVCFLNLTIIKQPVDGGAMVMAVVTCVMIGFSYFIIRKYFPEGDKHIFIFASVLSVIGIAMIYRLNTASSIKQIIWFAISVTCFILTVVIIPDLKRFCNLRYLFLAGTVVFMGMAMLIGTEINGSKNWVVVAGFSFQPSEFGKLFFVAYLASALKDYQNNFRDLIEPAVAVMVCLGFMVLQKDLGSALIFFGISITMLYIATSKTKYVIACIGLFAAGALISYQLF